MHLKYMVSLGKIHKTDRGEGSCENDYLMAETLSDFEYSGSLIPYRRKNQKKKITMLAEKDTGTDTELKMYRGSL